MNFQNTNKPFKVVISVGDESGIGPEIILKALYSNKIPDDVNFTLVGSKENLLKTYKSLRWNHIHGIDYCFSWYLP